ncbi:hypothetical protein [Ramlibacter alkalitolerans]|jgi:hypothetical protein|uniref:DUF1330 domain-containing protein n=1 Tax=Ramlibacter alkalitolerans TaxID=2039631 RepID=A0ABS1JPI0_9BURK|nr:hypothetical protein [Ramlibacter alkalitolerans]MBL0426173.1 hypothetical protein [Ramlibacter alkalitolerans]
MHLVQLLLPLYAHDGERLPAALFGAVRAELVQRFGGLTAYSRAPATGLWAEGPGEGVEHDDIVVYEVMVATLDRSWWQAYREELTARMRQKELVVRAQRIETL